MLTNDQRIKLLQAVQQASAPDMTDLVAMARRICNHADAAWHLIDFGLIVDNKSGVRSCYVLTKEGKDLLREANDGSDN